MFKRNFSLCFSHLILLPEPRFSSSLPNSSFRFSFSSGISPFRLSSFTHIPFNRIHFASGLISLISLLFLPFTLFFECHRFIEFNLGLSYYCCISSRILTFILFCWVQYWVIILLLHSLRNLTFILFHWV